MRTASLWAGLLGIEGTTVQAVEVDRRGKLKVAVQLGRRQQQRCGICHRRCPRYDQGEGMRHWRVLDLGATPAYLEAPAPRVRCRHHGVVVAAVPWARHGSRFSRTFEDQVAWLVTRCDLVWAHPGRDEATLERFFDELGPDRCQTIQQVSADAASWIANVVARRCPQAIRCMDPFHVIAWATAALDQVRREVWNQARRAGQVRHAADLKGARWALWRNPQDLTRNQQAKLAWIQRTNRRLYRAYQFKVNRPEFSGDSAAWICVAAIASRR